MKVYIVADAWGCDECGGYIIYAITTDMEKAERIAALYDTGEVCEFDTDDYEYMLSDMVPYRVFFSASGDASSVDPFPPDFEVGIKRNTVSLYAKNAEDAKEKATVSWLTHNL